MIYRLAHDNRVQRISDGAMIPPDPGNLDWLAYQAWVAQGNTPAPIPITEADVSAYRDQRLAGGFADPITGHTYQCDPESRGFLTAMGSSAGFARGGPNSSYPLIAADNSVVTLNPGDTIALINDRLMPWVSATVLYARALKTAIAAGNPPADITLGWP